jgi:ADP-ribose pyrophosphatase
VSAVRVLQRLTVFARKFLRVEEHSFEMREPGGGWSAPQTRLLVHRGDSVAALLIEKEAGLVHLVRQFRYATFDETAPERPGNGWLTKLVAGTLEPGESPESCIIREVEEETGFHIDDPTLIGRFYLSPGAFSEKLYLFVAHVSPTRRTAGHDDGAYGVDDEHIAVLAVPITEFLASVERMEIADAKAITAAEWLRRQRGA